jgi:hypothetical protein
MPPVRPANRAAKCPTIPATELRTETGDWLCVAGFVAVAVAVTMAPFILL